MGDYRRLDVYNSVIESGLMPLFYTGDQNLAIDVMKAIANGGARVMEITNRGDRAVQVFQTMIDAVKTFNLPIILGVGSIIDPGTASIFINIGANFIVSPINNVEVAKVCNRRKVGYIPGCGTVNEISEAEEMGAEIVKIFPGNAVGGPDFVKNLLGPMPWSNIMTTGGVDATEKSISDWICAGSCCLGMGSRLISNDLLTQRKFDDLSLNVEFCLKIIKSLRDK